MSKRVTPYNTGKVLIGSQYVPPKDKALLEPSKDMFVLQKSLIDAPKPTTLETWAMRYVLVFCLVVIALDLFVWRP